LRRKEEEDWEEEREGGEDLGRKVVNNYKIRGFCFVIISNL